MVDKIWSDWQKRSPENANSFFGGSVQAIQSFESYTQYPNGSPPYLNVRFYLRVLDLGSKSMDMCRGGQRYRQMEWLRRSRLAT